MRRATTVRMLLVGEPGSELRLAAAMAAGAGAHVAMADAVADAVSVMRNSGADLVLIEVGRDVAGFIASLRRERMVVPVFACGIDAPADVAVAAIRAGARDYLPLPPDPALIAAAIVSVARSGEASFAGLDDLALALAPIQAPLLIAGEAGSGKETLARAIYAASGRAGPFIVVDCAEIDPEMINSELFGHAPDEFPGAVARRAGRLAEAAGGMVYLREVAALPLAAQSRLATVLDASAAALPPGRSPARVVAGTVRDLDLHIAQGRFRPALLARLGLFRLTVPPLRKRRREIGDIARNLAARFAAANGLGSRPLAPSALALLEAHDWPGNVAELADVAHRAVLLAPGAEITAASIVLADGSRLGSPARPDLVASTRVDGLVGSTVEDVERALILETLKRCHGNRTSASTILGISVRTMRNKLKLFVEGGSSVVPVP